MSKSSYQISDKEIAKVKSRARFYDGYVKFMRVGLTVIAVSLALLIVLWPTINEEEVSFTLSYEDINSSDDQIRMVNPRYVGTDLADRKFIVEAEEGIQENPDDPRIRLTRIKAEMDLDDGVKFDASSETGIYLLKENILQLAGKVKMQTTDGYRFEGSQAVFDLNTKIATSDKPIQGIGPIGSFMAQGFEVQVDKKIAIFKNGVKMRIYPIGKDTPSL
jgi:lipopolysaccharide export system protein LptC